MQPEAKPKPGEQDYWQPDDERLSAQTPAASAPEQVPSETPLAWQASESIHHEKHALWFLGLVVASVVLLAISVFVIKSWTFSALIVVMAVAAAVISSRPPRVLQYHLSHTGLQINERTFSMHDFRAFGVVKEGPLYSIVLIPHKRFMPGVNVYFPAENGEQIVDLFGSVLPMEPAEPDIIDKVARKLHF